MLKKHFLAGCVLLLVSAADAQYLHRKFTAPKNNTVTSRAASIGDIYQRITYGGNLSASFGTYSFFDISPMVGYDLIEDRLVAGVGFTYQLFQQRVNGVVYKDHVYGTRLWSRFLFTEYLFAHAEYEWMNFLSYDFLAASEQRIWSGSPLVGGGFRQPLGENSAFYTTILFPLNADNPRSFYFNNSPIVFRVGFMGRF